MRKKTFNFKLKEELAKRDPLGEDREYAAERHPEKKNVFIISFEKDGRPDSEEYTEAEVDRFIEKGNWILI